MQEAGVKASKNPKHEVVSEEEPARTRILNAAFATFMEHGYAGASTLEIATRAKVSKRELYSLFENKEALFAAGVGARTARMQLQLKFSEIKTDKDLVAALSAAGRAILAGVTSPGVLAVYRLAIAESARTPKLAATLDKAGRQENRRALGEMLSSAQRAGLLKTGDVDAMAEHFAALLWTDLLPRLLLRVTPQPSPAEMAERAARATDAFVTLFATKPRA